MRKTPKKIYKGNLKGLGWISIILAVLVGSIVVGGFLFIPAGKRTPVVNRYITVADPNCKGDNLHLCTFRIITITPIPSPTSNPHDDGDDDNPPPGGNTPTPDDTGGPKPL